MVLEEENLSAKTLLDSVQELYNNQNAFIDAMQNSDQQDSIHTIIDLIEEVSLKS